MLLTTQVDEMVFVPVMQTCSVSRVVSSTIFLHPFQFPDNDSLPFLISFPQFILIARKFP